jgi:rubrerythrin
MCSRQLRQFAPVSDGPARCVECGTVVVAHSSGVCPMCHRGRMEGI